MAEVYVRYDEGYTMVLRIHWQQGVTGRTTPKLTGYIEIYYGIMQRFMHRISRYAG